MSNKYVVLFQRICFFAAFGFITLFIIRNLQEIRMVLNNLNMGYVLLSLLLTSLVVFISTVQFQTILRANGITVPFWMLFRQRAQSNLLNYIPGGVWSHANLALSLSQSLKVSVKTLSKLTAVFMTSVVVTGMLFGIFFLPFPLQLVALIVVGIGFASINFWINGVNALWKKLLPRFTMKFVPLSLSSRSSMLITGIASWVLTAAAFSAFMHAAYPQLSPERLFYTGSAYIVAWVIGLLALPFPSGIGIREGVMGYLLASVGVPVVHAIAISLVFRIVILVRDIIFYVIVWHRGAQDTSTTP
ncbi:MAG: lysylphosphatidylglycerol synthase domain-containing protein [Candidatus Roizmanbacteria bacterium]|nr:lysylphosphatidylglycerol synthase domain-containing protein [Candidatus Roizmanbacteria bacterium]